ncbi:MAG: zonular occludens toxin domain-containing protein [Candidatus Sedimenticola sp. (ex Thyasira tokunagai)]
MSTKIHHGSPGSYKSSGAIMDDLIPALLDGRTVVSNIRGLTEDRAMLALEKNEDVKELQKMPLPLKIIYVDTDTKKGREKMARWFHWAPKDAYIFIDEVQRIYPKRWTARDMAKLDFPGGVEEAEKKHRPPHFEDSHDMQRHYNWDLCLTTTHIKKVRDDIRQPAERAYKHKNKALLGNLPFFKGRYLEGDHSPDDNGTASSISTLTDKRIKPYVFDFYDSTTTGNFSDTKAGQSIFKNTRLLFALGVATFALGYAGYRYLSGGAIIQTTKAADSAQVDEVVNEAGGAADRAGSGVRASFVASESVYSGDVIRPFFDQEMDIAAYIKGSKHYYLFAIKKEDTWFHYTSEDFYSMGYQLNTMGSCAVVLSYKGRSRLVTCGARSKEYFESRREEKARKLVVDNNQPVLTKMSR